MLRTLASTVVFVTACLAAAPSAAQGEDIVLRGQAITDCHNDPNHLGFATEKVCIDEEYQELQQKKDYGTISFPLPNHSSTDPFNPECDSAATRIPCSTLPR